MLCRIPIGAAGLFCLAAAANAAITGAMFIEVPNNVWGPTGASPTADPVAGVAWAAQPYRTFDFVLLGSPGDLVNGVNAGGDANEPYHIDIGGGIVFNHAAGSDQRSMALEPLFSAIGFDTYATYGGNNTTAGHPFGGFAGAVNLTGDGGVIRFTSFAAPGNPAAVGADGTLRILRVSVANIDLFTFGRYHIQVGLPGGELLTLQYTPPSPGAASLLAIAALAGARRRR